MIDRVSIELSQRCTKACTFCYSGSTAEGDPGWAPQDVVAFVHDLAAHGVQYVSFGGGEPLEYPGLDEVLVGTKGLVGRAVTTNGLHLLDALPRLAGLEKLHVSVHHPSEVHRVIGLVQAVEAAGIAAGVNLLVSRTRLEATRAARDALHAAGIENDRIVYLPMRGADTPTPEEVASVAGPPFQSMRCLSACGVSPRFVSVGWDRSVAWCSYTTTRRTLAAPNAAALFAAMEGLGLRNCAEEIRA